MLRDCLPSPLGALAKAGKTMVNVRALALLALHFDRAAVLLHDAVADAQPKPVPLPTGLVVKNGSKIAFEMLGLDAAAGVGHLHDHASVFGLACGWSACRPSAWLRRHSATGSAALAATGSCRRRPPASRRPDSPRSRCDRTASGCGSGGRCGTITSFMFSGSLITGPLAGEIQQPADDFRGPAWSRG